jgi:hypothetical protein
VFIKRSALFITFLLGRDIYFRFLLRCAGIVSLQEAAAGGVMQCTPGSLLFSISHWLGILSVEDVTTI